MSRAQRDRGARGEREVVDLLKDHGYDRARRTSDGRTQSARGDIAHGPAGVHIEVKRTERLRLRDAVDQATSDARENGDLPVVMHRWDKGQWLAILPADELIALLRLRETA